MMNLLDRTSKKHIQLPHGPIHNVLHCSIFLPLSAKSHSREGSANIDFTYCMHDVAAEKYICE